MVLDYTNYTWSTIINNRRYNILDNVGYNKMERLKTILLFFLLPLGLLAQPKNTISQILMPYQSSKYFDLGFGYRYTRQILPRIAIYGSATFANHRLPNEGYINNHWKYTGGIIRHALPDSLGFVYYGIGICYSTYGDMYITMGDWPDSIFNPWSFELLVGHRFPHNVSVGIGFDFIKNEGLVTIGYSF